MPLPILTEVTGAVKYGDIIDGVTDLSKLKENDFQAVYFPDIGMSPHSIFLANMRLAPIQFCSPGHSVSTYGADIDYFITGATVEEPDHPEKNYSERLVLLPERGGAQLFCRKRAHRCLVSICNS